MRWIIGDVHGMLRPLEPLVNEIFRRDEKPVLYFVGDYVNRGPDSRGVIDLLLSLPNAKFIRGNHDEVLDHVLHGVGYADNPTRDRFFLFQWFLEHGLLQTIRSYGATDQHIGRMITKRNPEAIDSLTELFPPAHRQFIRSLPVLIEDDDLFVIHGKWPVKEKSNPKKILLDATPSARVRHEILWGRFDEAEISHKKLWQKPGYFGHTPVPTYPSHNEKYTPILAPKMVLLDTAAALSSNGRLTAISPETSTIIQCDVSGKILLTES